LKGDARVDGETISGDLPSCSSPVDAEFDIETFSGDIDNCSRPEIAVQERNTAQGASCTSGKVRAMPT
jgi:hypothetical protein